MGLPRRGYANEQLATRREELLGDEDRERCTNSAADDPDLADAVEIEGN
jgi:hypothetical protein